MNSLLAAVAALMTVLIASGCASSDDSTATASREERVYRTGSHFPVRDKIPMTKEEEERQTENSQQALKLMQKTGAGTPRPAN